MCWPRAKERSLFLRLGAWGEPRKEEVDFQCGRQLCAFGIVGCIVGCGFSRDTIETLRYVSREFETKVSGG